MKNLFKKINLFIFIMYSNYLFIGVCAVSGGLIYNAVDNLLLPSNVYEGRKNIFNIGMFVGLTVGSGISYLKYSQKLIKSSE